MLGILFLGFFSQLFLNIFVVYSNVRHIFEIIKIMNNSDFELGIFACYIYVKMSEQPLNVQTRHTDTYVIHLHQ